MADDDLPASLLWKGKFLRDNKALQNSNTVLRAQVKELTRRVEEAEGVAKVVKALGDRVGALEEDEGEVKEIFKRLDEENARRVRNVEEKVLSAGRRAERAIEKAEQMGEVVSELSEKINDRKDGGGDADGRVGTLEDELRRVKEGMEQMRREVRGVYESGIGETGEMRQRVGVLEWELEKVKERPAVAALTAFRAQEGQQRVQDAATAHQAIPDVPRATDTRLDVETKRTLQEVHARAPTPRQQAKPRQTPKVVTKAGPGRPCAECRKRHRKCHHGDNAPSTTPARAPAMKREPAVKAKVEKPATKPTLRPQRTPAPPKSSGQVKTDVAAEPVTYRMTQAEEFAAIEARGRAKAFRAPIEVQSVTGMGQATGMGRCRRSMVRMISTRAGNWGEEMAVPSQGPGPRQSRERAGPKSTMSKAFTKRGLSDVEEDSEGSSSSRTASGETVRATKRAKVANSKGANAKSVKGARTTEHDVMGQDGLPSVLLDQMAPPAIEVLGHFQGEVAPGHRGHRTTSEVHAGNLFDAFTTPYQHAASALPPKTKAKKRPAPKINLPTISQIEEAFNMDPVSP